MISDELLYLLRKVGALRGRHGSSWPFWAVGGVFAFLLPIAVKLHSKGNLNFDGPWMGGVVFIIAAVLLVVGIFVVGYMRWRSAVEELRKLAEDIDVRELMRAAKGIDERDEIVDLLKYRKGNDMRPEFEYLLYQIEERGFDRAADSYPTERELELVVKSREWSEKVLNRAIPFRNENWKLVLIVVVLCSIGWMLFVIGDTFPNSSLLRFLLHGAGPLSLIPALLLVHRRKERIRMDMEPEIDDWFGFVDDRERAYAKVFFESFYSNLR